MNNGLVLDRVEDELLAEARTEVGYADQKASIILAALGIGFSAFLAGTYASDWREALGEDWERVQATWLHILGNLTLTGYNSEYSDHGFATKRDMAGGFRESPLCA